MGKSSRKQPDSAVASNPSGKKSDSTLIKVDKKALDPGLESLFASSAGPVTAPPKSRYQNALTKHAAEEDDEDESSDDDSASDDASEESEDAEMASGSDSEPESVSSSGDEDDALAQAESIAQEKSTKKRKRGDKDEDLEGAYMQKLAREEAKDEEKRKKQKTDASAAAPVEDGTTSDVDSDSDSGESFTIPKHETQTDEPVDMSTQELEKASRTVFLGNVSSEAITSKSSQKELKRHLSSFIADLADTKPPHKLESLRFRSTAFSSSLPKRAAFAKKELMDTTTKSTNAYAVYTTKAAAREAVKRLNGTVILNRHLRVDSVAHPAPVDHRRCVFIGNLGFVDDESAAKANADDESKPTKSKPPSDVEEGLWQQFGKAGKVESVRVPRDPQTRVGKGFAYVQFYDETAVEAALQFNDQKYPPLLPRKLRVTRARAVKKNTKAKPRTAGPSAASSRKGAYQAKISDEQKSQQGRARAVLGKAAAFRSAEAFVFEGHRASSRQGKSGLKLGGGHKSGAKKGPNGRRERSRAWKANGNGKR